MTVPTPLKLPPTDLARLTDEWSQTMSSLDPRLPPRAQLWRRRTADGYLTCLVAQNRGAYIVYIAHTVTADEFGEPTSGRPPTVAELCDALNRFTPRGTPVACAFLSAGHPAPPWPVSVTLMLTQVAPNLEGGIQVVH